MLSRVAFVPCPTDWLLVYLRRVPLGVAGLLTCGMALTACSSSSVGPSTNNQPRVVVQSGYASAGTPPAPLPTVVGDFGDEPKISAGVGDPPTQARIGFVSEGTGARVTRGVEPEVRYVETDWKTGAVLHSSWATGRATDVVPTAGANIAFSSFFNGVRLGSRVEIVNPRADGDADIFVFDLLAQGTS